MCACMCLCVCVFIVNVGGSRFYDPRTKQSFKYDHLRKEASDYQPYEPDSLAEPWRSAVDIETLAYTANHYRHGVSSVFGRSQSGQITLNVCIEDHQFQPKNFWNGRWRSQWHVTFTPGSGSACELKGVLKAQVWARFCCRLLFTKQLSYGLLSIWFSNLDPLLWGWQRSVSVCKGMPWINYSNKRGGHSKGNYSFDRRSGKRISIGNIGELSNHVRYHI